MNSRCPPQAGTDTPDSTADREAAAVLSFTAASGASLPTAVPASFTAAPGTGTPGPVAD
jgi:hypothetical protein